MHACNCGDTLGDIKVANHWRDKENAQDRSISQPMAVHYLETKQ